MYGFISFELYFFVHSFNKEKGYLFDPFCPPLFDMIDVTLMHTIFLYMYLYCLILYLLELIFVRLAKRKSTQFQLVG